MGRVCACSQEKDCPVEKTLSNSPVKSEREVLLVGEFCLMMMPELGGNVLKVTLHSSCPPLSLLVIPGQVGVLALRKTSGCDLVTSDCFVL